MASSSGSSLSPYSSPQHEADGEEDEPAHIMVVDDDRRLRDLLQRYLSDNGFRVTTAGDAATARAKLGSIAFDLIVLDVMMPGQSGLELTRELRTTNTVPILLLTAMGEAEDRIRGLESGADDYLPKPFEPRELVLRIRTILNRVQQVPPIPARPAGPLILRLGEVVYYPAREELRRGEIPIRLTDGEASLLKALAEGVGQPLSRDELLQRSPDCANTRSVDVQVTRLRRKIEKDPRSPRYLQTVRGRGYMLRPD
jgi:two-component system phosphate regulon response regulator OmpR